MEVNLYSKKEVSLLVLLFLAATASLLFFLKYNPSVFPEHHIEFELTRDQATAKAATFLGGLGLKTDGYKRVTIFKIHDNVKTYLEKEMGIEKTAELSKSEVNLWHFASRFFKPQETETFEVAFLPNGRMVEFYKIVKEEAPGARLSKEKAQAVAELFMTEKAGIHLAEWKLISTQKEEMPNRTDHSLVWEKNNFRAKEASYRLNIGVVGDEIGSYGEYLDIPEAWSRTFAKERSKHVLASLVANVLSYTFFTLALFICFVMQFRRNNLRTGFAMAVGVVACLVNLLIEFNAFPLDIYSYDTSQSWSGYLTESLFGGVLSSLFAGLTVFFIVAPAETLYRKTFPKNLSLEASFGRGFATKTMNRGLFLGTFAGIFFFSYEILYYFIGQKIGFWSPAGVDYDDLFSTALPWVYPLFVGFMAAVTEEGVFRLFGIPFLKKYLKSTWLSVFITSVIWAALHANYPNSPWFARIVEISIVGMVFGYLFVRYGIVASLAAHYTFNALQTAIYFYSSGSQYAKVSATLVALVPLIVAVVYWVVSAKRRGFRPETPDMMNESVDESVQLNKGNLPEPEKISPKPAYKPLSGATSVFFIAVSIIGFVVYRMILPEISLKQQAVSIGPREAKQIAGSYLSSRGIQPDAYRSAAYFQSRGMTDAAHYILEQTDFDRLKNVYPDKLTRHFWIVRFFKPLEKEEFKIYLFPDGKILSVSHDIDEKSEGADLTAEEALELAKTYLAGEKGYRLEDHTLVSQEAEKKDHRTDHEFVFEEKNARIGEGTFRTELTIQGNEPSDFWPYFNIPEAWERENEKTSIQDVLVDIFSLVCGLWIAAAAVLTFLRLTKKKKIPFRAAFQLSGVLIAIAIIQILNNFQINKSCPTTISPAVYALSMLILVAIISTSFFFVMSCLVGLFGAMWEEYVGFVDLRDADTRGRYFRDALVAGYTVFPILLAFSSIVRYTLLSTGLSNDFVSGSATGLDDIFPAFGTFCSAAWSFIGIIFIGTGVLLFFRYLKKWLFVVFFFLVLELLPSVFDADTFGRFSADFIPELISLALHSLIVFIFLRNNLLAYFMVFYVNIVLSRGWVLFSQPYPFYQLNGALLLFAAVAPVLYYLFLLRRPLNH